MNRTAVKNYAVRARRYFQKIVTERANALGISAKDVAKAEQAGDMIVIKGRPFPKSIEISRRELVDRVRRDGFEVVVENIAYTLFNRFCALRFMEVNGYLPFRVFSSVSGDDTPEILKHALEATGALGVREERQAQIADLKMRGDQDQKLYSMLLLAQCNALAMSMPFLFERSNDVTELLMPENLLQSDSVVRDLVAGIDEADWQDIEIVGWLYQFYISEKKDQVIGKVVKKEDIPAATQLFTPRWIVQYMVENSLGRLWLQSHPDSLLKAKMPYYIENPDDAKLSPDEILTVDTPDEIRCIDPCCGSGHILVYMFDLLYSMYEETGYIQRDIPRMILKNNLHGIDIDERAAQLSGFALMMKAREHDPLFLENAVHPHVMAIEESNGIDLLVEVRLEGKEHRSPFDTYESLFPDEGLLPAQQSGGSDDDGLKPFAPLVRFFWDAKNYGSLLRVPKSLAGRLDEMETMLRKLRGGDTLFASPALPRLVRLVRQAKMLTEGYHVVTTNPPYVGGKGQNKALKDFLKEEYTDVKADTFSAFIVRNLDLALPGGQLGFMTPFVWMFISSYEKLRSYLIDKKTITSLVQLEYSGFDGATVPICTFTLENKSNPIFKGGYVRLSDFRGAENQGPRTIESIQNPDCGWFFRASTTDFKKIPGSPIAYWARHTVFDVFEQFPNIGSIAKPMIGMRTGDNERFLRLWFEISRGSMGVDFINATLAKKSGGKWFPYNKGGSFRKWYGNNEVVLDWYNDGYEVKSATLEKYPQLDWDNLGWKISNERYFFQPSVTWTATSSSHFGVRTSPAGYIFDVKGSSCFPSDGERLAILGNLASKPTREILKMLNPTIEFQPRDIGNVPHVLISGSLSHIEVEKNIVPKLLELSRSDWDAYERSWNFSDYPLIRAHQSCRSLAQTYRTLRTQLQETTLEMQRLEEENNRIFIEAYGLQDDLKPKVLLNEITLTCNPYYRYGSGKTEEEYEQLQRADTMKELISYAVGCMMGRYSSDTPGLQFAGGTYDHEKACAAASGFQPDADGILPVLADAYFEDDVTTRFAELLKATFGKEHLSENLRFVAEAIGIKGSESPQDTIRRFLAADFFKYHMKMYKKRPIYWLFNSGKEKAFQALVYLHRYTPSTLARMRTGYVHELQNKMRARIEDMEAGKDAATSTAQATRTNRDLTKLRKQLEELRVYDEKLHHYADQRIEIDLDDGVKHNYGLFGDLLAEVKPITGKKA